MEQDQFDDLSRLIATKTSRRQMLKVLATAAGGIFVASAGKGAFAAKSTCTPNKQCAQYCATVFGAGTAAAEQCSSEATHCTGACYNCGPASVGGTKTTCCPTNTSGHCSSYTTTPCCSSGQTCSNGSCTSSNPYACSNPGICPDLEGTESGCGGICTCMPHAGGGSVCALWFYPVGYCFTDSDCPQGYGCAGCNSSFCQGYCTTDSDCYDTPYFTCVNGTCCPQPNVLQCWALCPPSS